MDSLMALMVAAGMSLAASAVVVLALHAPMRRQLVAKCPDATAAFWMRSATTLIFLTPLFVVLAFGVPTLTSSEVTIAEVIRRTLAATTFTLALVVFAVALRLASLEPPGKFDQPVR